MGEGVIKEENKAIVVHIYSTRKKVIKITTGRPTGMLPSPA